MSAGTVFLNRCDYLDPALAWTGVKDSGRGVSLSAYGASPLFLAAACLLCAVLEADRSRRPPPARQASTSSRGSRAST